MDSVEVTDTKSSDEEATGRYLLDVIKTENSEVIVEGDVDVTTQGTVGTQVTSVPLDNTILLQLYPSIFLYVESSITVT